MENLKILKYNFMQLNEINFINIYVYLAFSSSLFFIGILGIFIIRQNIITILISIELMVLSVNLNFIIFSIILDSILGQVITVFILSIAGAEAAIGLALLIQFYRARGNISSNYVVVLKG